ncbi:serine/threonine-protein phosphatase 4 regulatory subunit 1-like, partial [Tropilaelaps mercedesae]
MCGGRLANSRALLTDSLRDTAAQTELLPPFLELCNDPSFHVRRSCAVAMVELCQVLDAQCIQNSLVSKGFRSGKGGEGVAVDGDERSSPSVSLRSAISVQANPVRIFTFLPLSTSQLATFLSLCEDDAWSVRKACSESFMAISCVVEPRLRLEALAPRFIKLLADRAKWVAGAAYQNLGPFISTFADPKRTGLELVRPDGAGHEAAVRRTLDYDAPLHESGRMMNTSEDDGAAELRRTPIGSRIHISGKEDASPRAWSGWRRSTDGGDDATNNNSIALDLSGAVGERGASLSRRSGVGVARPAGEVNSTDVNFNSFMYWRSPLPQVDELRAAHGSPMSDSARGLHIGESERPIGAELGHDRYATKLTSGMAQLNLFDEARLTNTVPLQRSGEPSSRDGLWANGRQPTTMDEHLMEQEALDHETRLCGVPAELLRHFQCMLEPHVAQHVDCIDLPRSCAYSLPAVALALGPRNWKRHLRHLVTQLSQCVQWKVRHSVASSLHSLVIIVGDRDSVELLVPLFHTLCRDVDEVRLPLLRNFYQMCIHLEPQSRRMLLDALCEFARSENERVWRLRDELARQIALVAGCFSFGDRLRYFVPILEKLLQDKVAQVRSSAALCFGPIIWCASPFAKTLRARGRDGPAVLGSPGDDVGADEDEHLGLVDARAHEGRTPSLQHGAYSYGNPGDISSYFDAMELVFRKLNMDVKWIKWQHKQAFARLITSIVEQVPDCIDILEGADAATVARATEGLTLLCDQSVGLRNMAVMMKLIRPEVEALLGHGVPNVRLEVAALLSNMAARCADMLIEHRRACEP